MQVIETSNKLSVLQDHILELPEIIQNQIFDFVEFLYNRHFETNFELHPDLKLELKERLREYRENPEDTISGEEMKAKWEKLLGRKL
jgi:hypothetical protein